MPKIRVVKVVFNTKIKAYEVPAFRGAVIDMIGREHVAFHNHIGENAYHYHYPYIQYKQQGGYAALLCIEDGVEDMQAFFQKKRPQIRIGDREVSLDVRSVQLNQFQVQIWDKLFEYRLYNWLPLNEKNYGMYLSLDRVDDRLMLLKRILIGNILSMAKGIGWTVDKEIVLDIREILAEKVITYKNVKLKSFDVRFSSNVFIPNMLGVGKGASTGFGVIRQIR